MKFYYFIIKRGSTGDRTQIEGVKVPNANHYTIEPTRNFNANVIQIKLIIFGPRPRN